MTEEAAARIVPPVSESVVDEQAGHALRLRIVREASSSGYLEHETRRLDVVAVGVVVGHRAPVTREVEVHCPRLDEDSIAQDGEQFLQAEPQRLVPPHLEELSEGVEQVHVGCSST